MKLTEFSDETFGFRVRVTELDGQEWFVAKDVCDILEMSNPTQALESLDDDEKGTCPMESIDQVRTMTIINESGLYALIFRSRKPNAKKFRRWVTGEVLPAVRRAGSYSLASSQAAPPMPVVHPAVQFLEVIDALRKRGCGVEKALYSVGNLFQSSLAGAYQSQRSVLPMALPEPMSAAELPAVVKTPSPSGGGGAQGSSGPKAVEPEGWASVRAFVDRTDPKMASGPRQSVALRCSKLCREKGIEVKKKPIKYGFRAKEINLYPVDVLEQVVREVQSLIAGQGVTA